jgi:hypothetical protein
MGGIVTSFTTGGESCGRLQAVMPALRYRICAGRHGTPSLSGIVLIEIGDPALRTVPGIDPAFLGDVISGFGTTPAGCGS